MPVPLGEDFSPEPKPQGFSSLKYFPYFVSCRVILRVSLKKSVCEKPFSPIVCFLPN